MTRTAKTLGGILAGPRKALAVLKDKKGLSASLPEVLGAVGIGILLLGLVGFGIGAGISFAQDSGAKGTLESVKSAQLLHQTKTEKFTADVKSFTDTNPPALSGDVSNLKMTVSADGRNFCAGIESTSMAHTKFWINSKTGKITEGDTPPTATVAGVACPTFP